MGVLDDGGKDNSYSSSKDVPLDLPLNVEEYLPWPVSGTNIHKKTFCQGRGMVIYKYMQRI